MRSVCLALFALVLAWATPAQAQWTPDTVVVLKGKVVSMTGAAARRAQVVIRGDKIEAIRAVSAPTPPGAIVIETRGFIYPGLINLHNHLEYNFLPVYPVPRHFDNHDQWPGGKDYETWVNNPWKVVTDRFMCNRSDEAFKFAEVRSIIGGETTNQGAANNPAISRSLVRNVELENFGERHVGQRSFTIDRLFWNHLPDQIGRIKLYKAWIVHMAEGIDDYSRAEWSNPSFDPNQPFSSRNRPGMVQADLVWPGLVGVHCTAMKDEDFALWKQKTGLPPRIVWSPTSNLLLYGKTTDVRAALRHGSLIALGTDWAPSGTKNLLWELKVVDQYNRTQLGGLFTDRQIVEMATVNPARMVHWQDKVGMVKAGMTADLLVVDDLGKSTYRNLIQATEANVQLVLVGGNPLYGDEAHLRRLKVYEGRPRYEVLPETQGPRPKAIDMLENPTARNGDLSLAEVRKRLSDALAIRPEELAAIVNAGERETATRTTYKARDYLKDQLKTLYARANRPVPANLDDPAAAITPAQVGDFLALKYKNLRPTADRLETFYTDARYLDALEGNLHWGPPYSAGVNLRSYLPPSGTTTGGQPNTVGITGSVPGQ